MKRLMLSFVALLASVFPLVAGAHTTIERATPPGGAVLDRSPARIEIKFKHAAQMTSVVVTEGGKAERKLTFAPTTSTELITIDNPNLPVGRNEVRWKALSKDGHVIGGTLVYVVKPTSASP